MKQIEVILHRYWFVVLMLFCIPAVWALFVPGFFGAGDDMHPAWLYEMDRAFKLGQFPPRFVPDLSFGFGYPLFNFVFPLPFYIGEIFHLGGLSFVDSIKAVFLISVPLSAISMFVFMRYFCSRILSFAAALLYVYTPYRATDLYVRGAIGEIVSFMFLPLLALSVLKLTDHKGHSKSWIGAGALALAGLALSHNIATYMFVPFVFLLGLMRILTGKGFSLKNAYPFCISMGLGLLGSLYFWLPALLDSRLMKYDTVFNFEDHFPTIKQLVAPFLGEAGILFGYGASVPGPYDGMSFYVGAVNVSLVILAVINCFLFWKKFSKEQKVLITWAFITLGAAFLLMNFRSAFLWKNLPLLPYFQFPWRFLILTTFITPAFLITFLPVTNTVKLFGRNISFGTAAAILVSALAVGLNWAYFRPNDFLGRTDSYYLNRYIPVPRASDEYKTLLEEYLRLPKDTISRPDKNYPRAWSEENAEVSVKEINGLDADLITQSETSFVLNYGKYNFPGWKAEIDGRQTAITPGYPFGQLSILIPSGSHLVKVYYSEPLYKRLMDVLSLGAILVSLILLKKNLNERN